MTAHSFLLTTGFCYFLGGLTLQGPATFVAFLQEGEFPNCPYIPHKCSAHIADSKALLWPNGALFEYTTHNKFREDRRDSEA